MNSYFIYITSSKTGTLYIGVTNSLQRRIFEHKNKLIPGFTTKYNADRLVYFQEFDNIDQAIEAEKKIKKWRRQKKINSIKSMNPTTRDLAEEYNLEISPQIGSR